MPIYPIQAHLWKISDPSHGSNFLLHLPTRWQSTCPEQIGAHLPADAAVPENIILLRMASDSGGLQSQNFKPQLMIPIYSYPVSPPHLIVRSFSASTTPSYMLFETP